MIIIEKANLEDAEKLTEIAKKSFLDDNKLAPHKNLKLVSGLGNLPIQ